MIKRRNNMISGNPSKSLKIGAESPTSSFNQEIFIAIVRNIVDHKSDILNSLRGVPEHLEKYIDNRNVAYVTPIDSNFSNSLISAHFLNSHDIDYPLPEEAVLCLSTDVGNIIIDRLSMHGFGLNYDVMDYIQSTDNFIDNNENLTSQEIVEQDNIRESIKKVAPYFAKNGARAILGRNNQYLVFDTKERIGASDKVTEHTGNGKFIKVGFKQRDKQTDTRNDSQIIFTKDALLQYMMSGRIPSEYNIPEDEEPDEGIGIQSKEIILKGRQFVVIYSAQDLLLKSSNLYIENQLTEFKSDRVNLTQNATNPVTKANELTDMLNDLMEIIDQMTALTPLGPAPLDPATKIRLQQLQLRYLRGRSKFSSTDVFL